MPDISKIDRTKLKNIFEIKNLNIYYGKKQAIKNVNLTLKKNKVTAFIGRSGCGKSTILRALNRMNDLIPNVRTEGDIFFETLHINKDFQNPIFLRSMIGMVFQKPTPFPFSIYENITYSLKIHGQKNKEELNRIVESSLKQAALWDEVKDVLHNSALELSGGQQQRLCIARAIALEPDVLLLDEPTSALDPKASQKIEQLILELKKKFTIIIVTHSMRQASNISDYTAFFANGELVEYSQTKKLFSLPKNSLTIEYLREV